MNARLRAIIWLEIYSIEGHGLSTVGKPNF